MTSRGDTTLSPQARVTREDWLQAARSTLITAGVDQVKVLPLARQLNVSRSSFYWYFRNRQELLDQLVRSWQETNTQDIVTQARRPSRTITEGVLHLFECWVDGAPFDPRLDFAIRAWARRSAELQAIVRAEDDARVEAISQLYRRHGWDETGAFIRARVLYFMQIGYYALELNEPREQRLRYTADYVQSFTGQAPQPGEVEAFQRIARAG
ncbi:TetR/AcrR family transcriptional regulator [Geminicoccus harenae]|uniref:TetR/AcrR family transcriptional regulator n=1 Tax=Geminicoccus harenae TaxID=2498453 RepID=UPI00168BADB4|nr:TetR/AcrR family transcriptional regulator [Geminicoccus harenae]